MKPRQIKVYNALWQSYLNLDEVYESFPFTERCQAKNDLIYQKVQILEEIIKLFKTV